MTSTCTYSDIVLPAATWYEKHDISTTDMHPFVHSFNPAIAPPWETRTDFDAFTAIAAEFSRLAATHLGTRTDVIAAPLMHDTADELAQPGGVVRDWKRGECEPVPGVTMPKLVTVERDYAAVAEKMAALGPLVDTLGTGVKGITWKPDRGGRLAAPRQRPGARRGRRRAARRWPGTCTWPRRSSPCRAPPTARSPCRAGGSWRSAPACELADLAEERAGERITFADTQVQPRAVITSPEWSGSETGGRRYSPFIVNVERKKPWHTLTGRMHFFLDHDWIAEYGEALPTYRPPLDYLRHFGEQGLREDGRPEITVRYLTPHSKWSIHSEYQDNLHMLRLFRGGPVIWMSPVDAAKIGVADNDWIEAYNRNGVVACRAVVTHRMPEGTVFMYHAKDRHLMTPKSEISGWHGGGDNSLTRLVIKPTHMIGGYAQLSYGFNYYGPTGNQRDEITVIRRRAQEVRVLMRVMAQSRDGDEPRQVHRLPHLLGHLQAGVDQPAGHRVRLLQQRRDQARRRLPEAVRGPGAVARRLDPGPQGAAAAEGGRPAAQAAHDLLQPGPAHDRRLRRPVDLRLPDADRRPAGHAATQRALDLRADRQGHGRQVGQQLGRRPRRRTRARRRRPEPGRAAGAGEDGVRAGVHVLPAAHLRALPQPVLRRVLPLGGDVQARGGRHRPGRPGPLPRLADVRVRLPVQEGVLQPPHRQGGEVHVLLPAHRGRAADDLLGDLRRAAALPRAVPLRRRQGARRRRHARRRRTCTRRSCRCSSTRRTRRCRPRPPAGHPADWIEAARRSPVYALAVRHRVALPLHPEYRTLPMVWYIPPLSPVADVVHAAGYDAPTRIRCSPPSTRCASRSSTWPTCSPPATPRPSGWCCASSPRSAPSSAPASSGSSRTRTCPPRSDASLDELDDLYRLLAIAKYDDRYVIPPAHAEDAGAADGPARAAVLQPRHRGRARHGRHRPARHPVPAARPGATRPAATFRADDGRMHFNLLGWNGQGDAPHLFPGGAGHERDRRVQAGLGAAAVPDHGAVRRPGRTRRVAATTSPRPAREAFARFLAWLRATPPTEVAQHYVETFDLRRRCALYLTYYRYGDTRKRGMAMLAFKTAYRDAGFVPREDELPDYLPMVLDFAALRPRGERLLHAHRADLELLRRALAKAGTPYAESSTPSAPSCPDSAAASSAWCSAAWESGRPARTSASNRSPRRST